MKRFIAFSAAALLAFDAGAERIGFDSAARDSSVIQIFRGEAKYTDRIHGELQLPSKGAAPFPAMVLMHASLGINPTIGEWATLFNDMGIATLVVDSFGPRGLSEQSANQLSFPAGVVDSLRALKTLREDAQIDSGRIGVIGFSRGAIAAMGAGFERYRAAVLGANGGKFALHVVFYGGCAQYAKTTGAPILLFMGTQDDFNNLDVCRKFTEIVGRQGTPIELVVYEGALHAFDTDLSRQNMPMIQNFRSCRMLQDLDTFQAVLLDGRALSPEERASHSRSCPGSGAARGGDHRFASAARERVKAFVAEFLHTRER